MNFDKTENIFIEGENLEVLKLLQKPYFGRIKMIYIDPPYNIGDDRIYKDDFRSSSESYFEQTGQARDGIRLTTNPETSGRFHSDWISFMYARLFLARNLLSDDGLIFVSIDDGEVHNVRLILNEIFGEENFVAALVWEGGLKNDSRLFSISHDYIICYAKNKQQLKDNKTKWRLRKSGIDRIYEYVDKLQREHRGDLDAVSDELKQWYGQLKKTDPVWKHRHYDEVDERGIYFPGDISWPGGGGPRYSVLHPKTKKPVKIPATGWRYPDKEKMLEMIKDDRVHFGEDETAVPNLKRYLHETEGQVFSSVIYKDRRGAKKALNRILDVNVFSNPKDVEVISDLIRLVTAGDDIILDFFAGSGTTAHAVMGLNREDGENRKFICVQIQEAIDVENRDNKDAVTFLKGLKRPQNIAEICKERMHRAVKELGGDDPEQSRNLDLGFKVFRLAKSNYRMWDDRAGGDAKKLRKQMRLFESPLVSRYKDIDVVYECAMKEGLDLNSKIERIKEAKSNTVYRVTGERSFHVCLDKSVRQQTVEELSLTAKDTFVCLDAALDDSQKANISMKCRLKTV